MVFGQILLAKLKAKGIADAEKVCMDVFTSVQESCVETVASVDPAATSVEKSVCAIATPVLAGLQGSVQSALDFNKDGKIG